MSWIKFLVVLPFALIARAAGGVRDWYRGALVVLHLRKCHQCQTSVRFTESLVFGCGWRP